MATYDFICTKCGLVEITKAMTDPNPTTCPRCGQDGLKKRFTAINKIMYGHHYVGGAKQPTYGKSETLGGQITPRT